MEDDALNTDACDAVTGLAETVVAVDLVIAAATINEVIVVLFDNLGGTTGEVVAAEEEVIAIAAEEHIEAATADNKIIAAAGEPQQ